MASVCACVCACTLPGSLPSASRLACSLSAFCTSSRVAMWEAAHVRVSLRVSWLMYRLQMNGFTLCAAVCRSLDNVMLSQNDKLQGDSSSVVPLSLRTNKTNVYGYRCMCENKYEKVNSRFKELIPLGGRQRQKCIQRGLPEGSDCILKMISEGGGAGQATC